MLKFKKKQAWQERVKPLVRRAGKVCGNGFIYTLWEQGWKANRNLWKQTPDREGLLRLSPVSWAAGSGVALRHGRCWRP